jgi:two-component system OmpR family sensor kinase
VSIRVRLALWGVAVAALTLLLFGFGLDRLVALSIPHDQDRQLADLGRRAVASIGKAAPASLVSGLSPVADDVAQSTGPFVAVLDADRRVLYASTGLDGAPDALPPALLARVNRKGSASGTIRTRSGVELRIHLRPWTRADLGRSGLVITGQAERSASKQISEFRWFLAVSGAIALVVAALATWVVSGRALRPLKQLAATTGEIGRTGDLRRRLPPRRSRDLIGVLTVSFNGMLDRLAAAQRWLEDALEAQRRFVADASHELRNPLTTIRSNAGFLLERTDAAERDRNEALADIAADGERMGRIVDDLLTLARTDARFPLERRWVDLGALLREVAQTARRADRPLRLVLDGAMVAPGDADALRRLVEILVDNAARHGAGEIELRLTHQGDSAVLTLSDRGPGIPEPALERIFDRFYQADPARQKEGAGLGLSIARSIAHAHGGSIRAANRQGGGATFTVALPLAPGPPPG